MKYACAIALLLALPAAPRLSAAELPSYLLAAVADKSRPAADVQRDAERRPAETMAFAGVSPGSTIVELMPGGGYFTRLLSKAAGPAGHVYAVVPVSASADAPDRSSPIKAIAAEPGYGNVTLQEQPIRALQLPAPGDLVWTSNNYHDVHNVSGIDLLAFNRSVFAALKPGGIYLVIDHQAAADAPDDVTSTLHRSTRRGLPAGRRKPAAAQRR
jgi:predicted methyltransferase